MMMKIATYKVLLCVQIDDDNNLYIRARHRKYIEREGNAFETGLDYKDSRLYISKYDANYNLLWEKVLEPHWVLIARC